MTSDPNTVGERHLKMPNILLGISGSIASYKAADLASKLVQSGYGVFPVLTRGASKFVTSATFSALTSNPCPIDTFEEPFPGRIAHIWLAQICDLILVAPASANVIARLAHGFADDMLTSTALASAVPKTLVPAMNTMMWENEATQLNVRRLIELGWSIIEPNAGNLACGTVGTGKMAEPTEILEHVRAHFARAQDLHGLKVLVTAGPTHESLDKVRFIGNRSSGKMGYAIAQAAADRGASVTLVSGPTSLKPPARVTLISVTSAAEMISEVAQNTDYDIAFAAAAVADYRPNKAYSGKMKKAQTDLTIVLEPTDDIVVYLGKQKRQGQTLVQFAAETENVLEYAVEKMVKKGSDWIVANDITVPGAGFDCETNVVTILSKNGETIALPIMTKRQVADALLDLMPKLPIRTRK